MLESRQHRMKANYVFSPRKAPAVHCGEMLDQSAVIDFLVEEEADIELGGERQCLFRSFGCDRIEEK